MNIHEIVVIVIVAIVVFKPEHLPEVAKMLGKTMRQCKKIFSHEVLMGQINSVMPAERTREVASRKAELDAS
ncbi:MAG TPA: twin-arginine translocase TatA/TatE family subunit [Gammaproteobacteria bacterium]|jgi:Sec-independent protein translocase protein TatA|nr:twin-arginine translocase TatA/TatE family subunit [Gammaproteobacteria bacterium]